MAKTGFQPVLLHRYSPTSKQLICSLLIIASAIFDANACSLVEPSGWSYWDPIVFINGVQFEAESECYILQLSYGEEYWPEPAGRAKACVESDDGFDITPVLVDWNEGDSDTVDADIGMVEQGEVVVSTVNATAFNFTATVTGPRIIVGAFAGAFEQQGGSVTLLWNQENGFGQELPVLSVYADSAWTDEIVIGLDPWAFTVDSALENPITTVQEANSGVLVTGNGSNDPCGVVLVRYWFPTGNSTLQSAYSLPNTTHGGGLSTATNRAAFDGQGRFVVVDGTDGDLSSLMHYELTESRAMFIARWDWDHDDFAPFDDRCSLYLCVGMPAIFLFAIIFAATNYFLGCCKVGAESK